jgi:hypothetical protein
MYLHVERWTTRPAWQDLSAQERIAYLDRLGPGLRRLTASGVRLVGTVLKGSTAPDSDWQYVAVWAMPSGAAQVRQLRDLLDAVDWHDYFRAATAPVRNSPKTFFEYGDDLRGSDPMGTVRRN